MKTLLKTITKNNIPIYSGKGEYIVLNNDMYVAGASDSFVEYKFTMTRQGGSNSSIKFNKIYGNYLIGDRVEYYINSKKKWAGYIQTIENNGKEIVCNPLWYKLTNQTIQGSLIAEGTMTVYDAVVSLREKIEDMNIIFNEPACDLYKTLNVTTSFSGRNIADILDEIVKVCPETTVWGVDVNEEFYFKSFSEDPKKTLNWYYNDFVSSDYKEDASDLYTGYVVSKKVFNSDEYETLPIVVGDDPQYPPPDFIETIGKRIGKYEFTFAIEDNQTCYQEVSKILHNQTLKEDITIKKLNKDIDIDINEAIRVILEPTENYNRDIDIGIKVSQASNIHNFLYNDNLFYINDNINTFYELKGKETKKNRLSLKDVDGYYKKACNECSQVYLISVVWKVDSEDEDSQNISSCYISVEDGSITRNFYSVDNRCNLNVEGMDKRKLEIRTNIDNVYFIKMKAYFKQGSVVKGRLEKVDNTSNGTHEYKLVNGVNVINIEYNYKNSILETNLKLSKLNSKNVSWFFNQNSKIKKLETLFNNN